MCRHSSLLDALPLQAANVRLLLEVWDHADVIARAALAPAGACTQSRRLRVRCVAHLFLKQFSSTIESCARQSLHTVQLLRVSALRICSSSMFQALFRYFLF